MFSISSVCTSAVLVALSVLALTTAPVAAGAHAEEQWVPATALPAPRRWHSMVALPDGTALVAGGVDDHGAVLRDTLIYTPDKNGGRWAEGPPMATPRFAFAMVVRKGSVIALGGCSTTGCESRLASAEVYDTLTRKWRTGFPHMRSGRSHFNAAITSEGRIVVPGGLTNESGRSSAELFEPLTGEWRPIAYAFVTEAISNFGAGTLPDNRPIMVGGVAGTFASDNEATYDYSANRWAVARPGSGFPHALFDFGFAALPNGSMLATGGAAGLGSTYDWAWRLNASTMIWHRAPRMLRTRFGHAMCTLEDGTVLVAGGATGEQGSEELTATTEIIRVGSTVEYRCVNNKCVKVSDGKAGVSHEQCSKFCGSGEILLQEV